MRYDLKKPCDHCPFRTDCLKGWLGEARATEIAEGITEQQQSFPCHKTTVEDDEGSRVPRKDEQHCAGAMILLSTIGQPNQMMRIAHRLRMFNPESMAKDAPVFASVEDFIDHHANDE